MGKLTVALIVSSWVIPISLLTTHIVPHPYMDEIFHIPQAQQYCNGNFRSWDPMITTPPGLYYLSLAHAACLFPGMLLLRQDPSFPNLGALAVCIRQTNVIWMLFVACISIIEMLLAHHTNRSLLESEVFSDEKAWITPKAEFANNTGLRRRKSSVDAQTPATPSGHKADISKSYFSGVIDEVEAILFGAWHLKKELLISFSPFVLVLGSFVAFVFWNGSVVLGAKEDHAVSPHFAQIMYFALVSALFSAPFHLTLGHGFRLLRTLWYSKLLSFALVFGAFAVGMLSVHFFSIAHPYLLADNRHYTFYIWRKVIKAHSSMKYVLVPLYVYSWLSILLILGKIRSKIWVLAYFLACVAVLVPTPLIEFRYYTIPFFIFMLNCGIEETSKWLLMGILYMGINGFTLYMFLYRPFYWAHEPGVQRFLW